MMGIVVLETCWANNKICNKNHLLHLVGILFPHATQIFKRQFKTPLILMGSFPRTQQEYHETKRKGGNWSEWKFYRTALILEYFFGCLWVNYVYVTLRVRSCSEAGEDRGHGKLSLFLT
jgi:hypothetical protein